MDPITAVGTGLAVIGSKDLLTKILGPTADYLGGELKGLVEKCNINLDRIFTKAKGKLGDKLNEQGQVNPRVLKHILDEGGFCEDELTAEYYGGILASSKTEYGRDDRGVTLLSTIKALSVYQLRMHYLMYSIVNHMFAEKSFNIGADHHKMTIYIPSSVYLAAMEFSERERSKNIVIHSITGLAKHGLIGPDYFYGSKEYLQKQYQGADDHGFIFEPIVGGAELFLWANGVDSASGHEITEKKYNFHVPEIKIIEGSKQLSSK